MRTFAQKPKATQQTASAKPTRPGRTYFGQRREVTSMLHLQRTLGTQAAPRVLETNAEELEVGLASTASPRFAHDFSQVSVYPESPPHVQAKLTVGSPGNRDEQEADRVADLVMSMSEPHVQRACGCGGSCSACGANQKDPKRDLLQTKAMQTGGVGTRAAPQAVHKVLGSTGRPLEYGTRSFFEPRFGHDFSQVRLHTNQDAAEAARAVNALAFTVGRNIVFGAGRYQPQSPAGKNLLAHELTHMVQQGGTNKRSCVSATARA